MPPPLYDVEFPVTVKPLISAWQFVSFTLELLVLISPPVIVTMLSVATIGEPFKPVTVPLFIINVPFVTCTPVGDIVDVDVIVAPSSTRVPPSSTVTVMPA